MKKNDFYIIGAVLLVSLAAFGFTNFFSKSGRIVTVKQNNSVVYSGNLYEDNTVELGGNTLEIKNGKIKMVYASCKNQICVNHKEIHKKGESIVCLPNKVTVEIE